MPRNPRQSDVGATQQKWVDGRRSTTGNGGCPMMKLIGAACALALWLPTVARADKAAPADDDAADKADDEKADKADKTDKTDSKATDKGDTSEADDERAAMASAKPIGRVTLPGG